MKKVPHIKTLLLLPMMISLGGLLSCDEKEELKNNGEVALLSFGPSGVRHGDLIKIVGWNLDKVTGIALSPGIEIGREGFVSHSKELIEIAIPDPAEEGRLILRTPDTNIESKTVLSFDVPVSIASFTQEAKPGNNITVTGEFVNWIRTVTFPDDLVVDEFVSRSLTEVVLTVPMEAKSGALIFSTGGTEPMEIDSEGDLTVTLPAVTSLAPDPIARGSELTIAGTDLDLVRAVKFKGNVTVEEAGFISKTASEIVVVFPEAANKGTIALVAYSGVEVESEQAIAVEGDLPPLEALALPFYADALDNGWQKWGGWGGGSADLDNAENVRDGQKAIKVIFVGGWGGALQLGGASSSTAGYTEFAISIYGDIGTDGKQVNLILKNGGDVTEKIIAIVEGEWIEYKFSIADDLGGIATITEFFLQDRDWSGTLYVDHLGLR